MENRNYHCYHVPTPSASGVNYGCDNNYIAKIIEFGTVTFVAKIIIRVAKS